MNVCNEGNGSQVGVANLPETYEDDAESYADSVFWFELKKARQQLEEEFEAAEWKAMEDDIVEKSSGLAASEVKSKFPTFCDSDSEDYDHEFYMSHWKESFKEHYSKVKESYASDIRARALSECSAERSALEISMMDVHYQAYEDFEKAFAKMDFSIDDYDEWVVDFYNDWVSTT